MHLGGKRIWIIGASAGIGYDTAIELARRGAIICASARKEEALQTLLEDMSGDGHAIATCDVTEQDTIEAAYKTLTANAPIDAVMYFAGVYEPMAWSDWNLNANLQTVDINLNGLFRTIDVLRSDIDNGTLKQLYLTGSVAGYRGLPKSLSYGATKAAMNYLAEALRIDLEDKGTKVHLITPGFVKTRLTDKNDFKMPMRITSEQAAEAIANGMEKEYFEIHFPRKFTYIMKLLQQLPYWLYFRIARSL